MLTVPMTLLAVLITWLVWRRLSRSELRMGTKAVLIVLTAILSVTVLFLAGIFLSILFARP